MGGESSKGYSDVFSYSANGDDASRKLGSLYVVGNVSHETDDMSYIINLIASLGKREYYALPDPSPREAFANTLKKINEVVEEFFKNKGLEMNVGIFAIAGENIFISKLGKFKILLARANKNIDILNNVQLFSKEHIEEKEFSNVISGKIVGGDRILAYYPERSLTTRAKLIEKALLDDEPDAFVERLNGMKEKNKAFTCAAVLISIDELKETATMPRIQPEERPLSRKRTEPLPEQVAPTMESGPEDQMPTLVTAQKASPRKHTSTSEPLPVIPKIIPIEFDLAKKMTAFAKLAGSFTNLGTNYRKRVFVALGAVVVLVGAAVAVQTFLLTDPATKQANAVIDGVAANIQTAKSQVSQSNIFEARALLYSSLDSLNDIEAPKAADKTTETRSMVIAALDEIDHALEVSPSLYYQLPEDTGNAGLLAANGTALAVFSQGTAGNAQVLYITGPDSETSVPVNTIDASRMFMNADSATLADINHASTTLVTFKDGTVKTVESPFLSGAKGFGIYEDNLYVLKNDGVDKVNDFLKGKNTTEPWLAEGQTVSPDAALLAVDGNIFTLSGSGTLTTYFRGKKEQEFQTMLPTNSSFGFTTNKDNPSLYVFDKELGRIYLIDKTTGSVSQTLKIGSQQAILSIALAGDGSLYFLTKDNKVWKIQ